MAIDETLVLKGEGNVDVQIGGPGNSWVYLSACASMGGASIPKGGTELRYCQDVTQSGKFTISNKIKTAADAPNGSMVTKLGQIDYLDGLECSFGIRARYSKCGARENVQAYDPLMLTFSGVDLESEDYDDLVISDPGNEDEIMVTTPWTATYAYRIVTVVGARLGSLADLGDQPINSWAICDTAQCAGYCGTRKDGCSLYYGVTDLDTSPYGWSNLITGIKDVFTGVTTWYTRPIIGVNGNVEGLTCAGDRVIVSSNSASLVAYNDTFDEYGVPDQDTWNIVTMTHAPAANGNALYARTTLEVWVACADGYVGKSTDGGATWSYISVGTALNAIYSYAGNLTVVVGDTGQMYLSGDGGSSWTNITEVATVADNLLCVKVPPSREREIFVGTNAGEIYRSRNQGATFAEMTFSGSGAGSVDDIAFAGDNGDVLWILHNNATPQGRILRDLSGGNGGADVEVAANYTAVIAAGVQLNTIAACDVNTAFAAGEVSAGYPALIKVS
ncbi:MAG TPA: hypothetical protein VM537_33500 [Anaerolineae bacterium]|nr:hypothetical protein [Anaerolineae bacterium]